MDEAERLTPDSQIVGVCGEDLKPIVLLSLLLVTVIL